MKKLLVIALAALLGVGASAQDFGVIAGFTSSSATLKGVSSGTVAGFHIGGAYNLRLPLGFALQPELIYNVKGTSLSEAKANVTVGYLELGVQGQWGTNLAIGRLYAFLDPYLGYGVNNDFKFSSSENVSGAWNYMQKLEYGVGFGVGFMFAKDLMLSAKYYYNFGSLYDENGNVKASMSDLKTVAVNGITQLFKGGNSFNGVTISVGYFF